MTAAEIARELRQEQHERSEWSREARLNRVLRRARQIDSPRIIDNAISLVEEPEVVELLIRAKRYLRSPKWCRTQSEPPNTVSIALHIVQTRY